MLDINILLLSQTDNHINNYIFPNVLRSYLTLCCILRYEIFFINIKNRKKKKKKIKRIVQYTHKWIYLFHKQVKQSLKHYW